MEGRDEEEKEKNKESLLIFYFSGHSYEDNKEGNKRNYYLCPHDFDYNTPSTTGIHLLSLREEIDALNCKQVLFLLDCCFSGKTLLLFKKKKEDLFFPKEIT